MTTRSREEPFSGVTIGNFDGVHLGHQKVLSTLTKNCKQKDLNPIVISILPHPRTSQKDFCTLLTEDEKKEMLKHYGINQYITLPFSEIKDLSPQDFIDTLLHKSFNIKYILVGYDHKFGKNRAGNIETLKEFSSLFDYEVEMLSEQKINHQTISSSNIRNLIDRGKVEEASLLLGYNYFISSKVVEGKKIGREIGFPTANFELTNFSKVVPKYGVYLTQTDIEGKAYNSITNVGTKPTINASSPPTIETFILDFEERIYGKTIKVEFIKHIRDEKQFKNLQELKFNIDKDISFAETFFKKHINCK